MSNTIADLAGRLQLRPGSAEPVRCERPVVAAAMMRKLTHGRRATLLPELLGALFTLCSGAHRLVSRRAVLAALAEPGEAIGSPAADAQQVRLLALLGARDHLQRLALDLPGQWPVAGVAADPGWLRLAPVWSLATGTDLPALETQQATATALPRWLTHQLLGLPPADWLAGWRDDPERWLADWAASRDHPVAQWLRGVQPLAQATRLPCRALDLPGAGDAGLRQLAHDLVHTPGYASLPCWQGAPAETGAWTRGRPAHSPELSLWHRLGARLAEVAALTLAAAGDAPGELAPALGAITLAPGQALAWCEMSRGLLVHWVRLDTGPNGRAGRDTARVDDYRVLAPTEWNFHPDGSLAQALRQRRLDLAQTRLATLALDPCVVVDLIDEPPPGPAGAEPAADMDAGTRNGSEGLDHA